MARKQGKKRSSRKSRKRRQGTGTLSNAECLRKKLDWLLPDSSIFAKVRWHGNISWAASSLVILALFWSWSEARNVTDAFTEASAWYRSFLGCTPLTTYQGFMGALARWTPQVLPIMIGILQQRMAGLSQIGGGFYRVAGWVPIAFDGSRSSASRTKSNEEEFCAKNYGKGKTAKYRKKKSKGQRRKKNERTPLNPKSRKPGSR